MIGSAGLMLVCRWTGVNPLSQINSVLQFIYLARIYLLKVTDGNTRWMCEICWKLTIKTPNYCHLSPTVNFKHILYLALVFLVFLLFIMNKLGSKSNRSKKPWYSCFVARKKKVWFIVVRGELRTCGTFKMDLFAEIVYSLKSWTI